MKNLELTNEQMIKALLKDLSTIETAILRERIVKIFEITEEAIKENPDSFRNPIIHYSIYNIIGSKVNKHLGFNN
jgi:hypothetical protein